MGKTKGSYVYSHSKLDGTVFYIGIGYSANHKRAFQRQKRNQYWKRIVNKYGLKVNLLLDGISWEEAISWEKYLIGLYGRVQFNNGNLCNLTSGGEGIVGRVMSDREKELVSKRNKGVIRQYNIDMAAQANRKPLLQFTKEGIFVKEWDSLTDAMNSGFSHHISEVCKGHRKSASGYVWYHNPKIKEII